MTILIGANIHRKLEDADTMEECNLLFDELEAKSN